jgi:hypothetical protein
MQIQTAFQQTAHEAHHETIFRRQPIISLSFFFLLGPRSARFGGNRYIMFNNSHGSCVDRILGVYARELADADEGDVPVYAWGAAVLASTYRGLCDAVQKNQAGAIHTGCPILLQLWSYERIAIARPIIDQSAYDARHYGEFLEDGPTMGTMWYTREVCNLNIINFIYL